MIDYNHEILTLNPPNKNFSLKRHRKLASMQGHPPLTPIPYSQPVSPMKLIPDDPKTSMNTQRYSHLGFHKNPIPPHSKLLLPALVHQTSGSKRSESPIPQHGRYLLPVTETRSHEYYLSDVLSHDLQENQTARGNLIGNRTKQEPATIEVDKPSLRIKPLVIQNRMMAKFGVFNAGSQQAKNFKRKTTLIESQENPELFTFYPKQHESDPEISSPN